MQATSRLILVLLIVAAGGCAPRSLRFADAEPAGDVLAGHWSLSAYAGPIEDTYVTEDGTALGFLAYRAPQPATTAMVYLHGIESNAAWFAPAALQLHHAGYDVFCLDRRGSGINRENRGFTSGYVDHFDRLIADVRFFIEALEHRYDRIVLIGLSWGGKYAITYANAYPAQIDGLVLITPGIFPLVDLSGAQKMSVLWNNTFNPKYQISTPITLDMFSTDPRWLAFIENDDRRLTTATARFFMESRKMDQYLAHVRGTYDGPMLLILADGDRIIDNDKTLAVLGDQYDPTVYVYENQTHSVQLEATGRLVSDITRWINSDVVESRP